MVLYMELQKAIYGMLKRALLFYLKLVGDLEKDGFQLNPYDPCVANKTVSGSQLTVIWHSDDLKTSHKNPKVVTKFISYLNGIYPGTCVNDQLFDQVVKYFPEAIVSTAVTPAAECLFSVREDSEVKKLNKKQASQFHHTVTQLLFATRVQRDIQLEIAFLTTRVKPPDKDDWGKIKQVLRYVRGTIGLKVKLRADSLSVIKWWANSSFAVHPDMRGHTGGRMSLGAGAQISKSLKQKQNGRSLTDNEICGADNMIGPVLQTPYFMEAQGYKMDENIMFKDNMSSI
ncbi:hypothetical protein ACHAWF_000703 [Thalassiosira exigua]